MNLREKANQELLVNFLKGKTGSLKEKISHLPLNKQQDCQMLFSYLSQLNKANFTMSVNPNETILHINDLNVYLETALDTSILWEIFIRGDYNIKIHRPAVLWDIGMNVGFASLYFSLSNYITQIIACEPIVPNFQSALKNFEINKPIANKITPHNVGLGEGYHTIEVDYYPEIRGSVGVFTPPGSLENREDKTVESLKIVDATDFFNENVLPYIHKQDFIIKIDCEGAEYEIIPNLIKGGVLEQVNMIMMEWHVDPSENKIPTALVDMLQENNFTVLFHDTYKPNAMIYAWNNNRLLK